MKTYNPSTDSTITPVAISGKRKRGAIEEVEAGVEAGEALHQEEEQLGGYMTQLIFLSLVSDDWL